MRDPDGDGSWPDDDDDRSDDPNYGEPEQGGGYMGEDEDGEGAAGHLRKASARGAVPKIDFGYDKYPHSTRKAPTIELDITKIDDLEFDGIEGSDYPDFSNAFISSADYEEAPGKFRKLTDDEIDWVMDNHGDWFYEKLMDHIY